jgi:hypothetical protein
VLPVVLEAGLEAGDGVAGHGIVEAVVVAFERCRPVLTGWPASAS